VSQTQIATSVTRGRLAQQVRVERMAWSDVLVEGIGVLYLKFAPPDRPLVPKGAHNPWSHRLRPTGLQAIY